MDLFAATLKSPITLAWDLDADRLAGGPKWLDTDRFDIVAKASTGPPTGRPIDFETTQAMLRALLVERFKLEVHQEDQPMTAYALVAPKRDAKLKKADDSNRSGCKYAAASAVLSKVYTCQNVTMAQFAERLQSMATAYIDRPVVNATGLQGSFDFVLSFTPKGSALLGGPSGEGASAADPSGAMTVFEALDRQLGLKLGGDEPLDRGPGLVRNPDDLAVRRFRFLLEAVEASVGLINHRRDQVFGFENYVFRLVCHFTLP